MHTTDLRKVGLAVQSGKLIVGSQQPTRYALEELLAQCAPKAHPSKEEREWLDDKPAGGEII
jgi:antitoxin ChpS